MLFRDFARTSFENLFYFDMENWKLTIIRVVVFKAYVILIFVKLFTIKKK